MKWESYGDFFWILEHELSQEDHGKMMAESIVGTSYIPSGYLT